MKTKVQRWGNSLALRIPKPFALEANLDDGESVDLSLVDGTIVIQRSSTDYALDELLAGITSENIHAKVDSGVPLGNEIW